MRFSFSTSLRNKYYYHVDSFLSRQKIGKARSVSIRTYPIENNYTESYIVLPSNISKKQAREFLDTVIRGMLDAGIKL